MKMEWTDGFRITVKSDEREVLLSANREGLLSLACQLRALAEGAPGDHIHYDAYNALEEGSSALIIEKTGGQTSALRGNQGLDKERS